MYYTPRYVEIAPRCATDTDAPCVYTKCAAWRLAVKPTVFLRSQNAVEWDAYKDWQKDNPPTKEDQAMGLSSFYPEPDKRPAFVRNEFWVYVGRVEESHRMNEHEGNFLPHWVENYDDALQRAIQETPGFCGLAGRPRFGAERDFESEI